jgi:hypothetical protein
MYGQPQTGAQPETQPQYNFTRDETALIVEAERERLKQAGDPRASIMPPTHLTPAGTWPAEDGAGSAVPTTPTSRGPRPQ